MASNALGISDTFGFEPTEATSGYGASDGVQWLERLREQWVHEGGSAPYLRHDLGAVVRDLAPLVPDVTVQEWDEVAAPPEGFIRVPRKTGGDFENDGLGGIADE